MKTVVTLQRGPAALEGLSGIRIGNLRAAEGDKSRELAPAAFADSIGQRAMMIGEELEGRAAEALLAHEQQGNVRAEKLQCRRRAQSRGMGERRQAVAERAIADLIVVLQEKNEGGRRQVGTRRSARLSLAIGRSLALVGEAFGQAA